MFQNGDTLLRRGAGITKWEKHYYKLGQLCSICPTAKWANRQIKQNGAVITKLGST